MTTKKSKFNRKLNRLYKSPWKIVKSLIYKNFNFLSVQKVKFDDNNSKIFVDLRTSSGLSFYRFGYWDSSLELISSILEDGDVFIDAGANIGMYSLVAASRVGPNGHVISVEPTPEVANLLKRSISISHFENCSIKNLALSDKKTKTKFYIIKGHNSLNSFNPVSKSDYAINVEVDCMDNIISSDDLERLKAVKLDIEGAELDALKGAKNIINETRAYFFVEIVPERLSKFNSSKKDVYSFFEQNNYIKIENEEWNPNVLFCPYEKYDELKKIIKNKIKIASL